jgi:hypothetical protein
MRRRRARKPSALARDPGEPMLKPVVDVSDPSHIAHAPQQPLRADGTSARSEEEPVAHHLSAVERLDGLAEPTDSRR